VMTKNGPIECPADLDGKKIRVMPSRLMIDTLNAMGASATDMAQGEVYSALQTGLLDGWENNPPTCLSFKMYETGCTHFAWTRHLAIPDVMLLNKDYFTQLTEQEKQWVTQAARDTVSEQRRLWNEGEQQAVARLREANMTFNEVDMAAFRSAVASVYAKYYEKYGATFKQTCEEIRSVQP
jgi:TRAP-type C4-dicarboxylate transport system substrate-binding protein